MDIRNQMKLIVGLIFITGLSYGQELDTVSAPMSYINLVGRYTEGKGIELRFFPDKKSVLDVGFKYGFVIERKLSNTEGKENRDDNNNFSEIGKTTPYDDQKWSLVIKNEKDSDNKIELENAREFLKDSEIKEGGIFNLDKGIAGLQDQKSREDFQYMVFALSALKNSRVAEALGLGFIDSTALKGKTYVYRVRTFGKSDIYDVVPEKLEIKAEITNKDYSNSVYIKQGDGELFFAWIDLPEFSGYSIERANSGTTIFTQLNSAPLYNTGGSGDSTESRMGYNDKNLTNYKIYRYRFYGYTLFGEKKLIAEIKGMPKDLTPPEQPFLPQPLNTKPNEVLVKWEMNSKPAPDLKGFLVARSNTNRGEFKLLHKEILSKGSRSFIDTTFLRGKLNYYIVQAIDTANNISSSFPVSVTLIDSIPPEKPVWISALIDTLGIVTLKVEKNKEKDLMGYRIFKSNSPEHEFSVIHESFVEDDSLNEKIETVFKDTVTLNSLTPKIYYRIRALDFNFNQSEISEIISVVRPDTIPPVTPIFNNVIVKEKEIELQFVPSSSEDVKEQLIYRKIDMKGEWEILKTLTGIENKFIDTAVTTGVTYYYTIRARDLSGLLSSYANEVYGKPFDTGVKPTIEKFTADVEKESIVLRWEYPETKIEAVFIIYKQDVKGMLKQYAISKEKKYIDSNPDKENHYAIKVVMGDGGESKLSNVLNKVIEKK
ncbi:MAG: hypothetical protein WC055_09725 [Melioribacteraceae bacterium]